MLPCLKHSACGLHSKRSRAKSFSVFWPRVNWSESKEKSKVFKQYKYRIYLLVALLSDILKDMNFMEAIEYGLSNLISSL